MRQARIRRSVTATLIALLLLLPVGAAAGATNHGNTDSKIFHKSSCRHYNCKNCTRVFKSRDAAVKAGYRACKVCKP